jgi:hypothetical protein
MVNRFSSAFAPVSLHCQLVQREKVTSHRFHIDPLHERTPTSSSWGNRGEKQEHVSVSLSPSSKKAYQENGSYDTQQRPCRQATNPPEEEDGTILKEKQQAKEGRCSPVGKTKDCCNQEENSVSLFPLKSDVQAHRKRPLARPYSCRISHVSRFYYSRVPPSLSRFSAGLSNSRQKAELESP